MIMAKVYRLQPQYSLVICAIILLCYQVEFGRAVGSGPAIFDVTKFGAVGNGKPEYSDEGESLNGLAFIQAWQKACHNIGGAKVVIPPGKFSVAQVLFSGPCQDEVTVELQGDIIPDPDRSQYPNNELFVFQLVEGTTFTGPGTIDVGFQQIPDDPEREIVFMDIMPSITLMNVTNFVLEGIKSKNPSAFHVLVDSSNNVTINNGHFDTVNVIPKTHSNAIYISSSTLVSVRNSYIKTGDDCITISGGSGGINIEGVTCVKGQGISIGAQPIRTPEADVKTVRVKNCTFKEAAFGARLNPRPHEKPGQLTDIIFEDLMMHETGNPIVINQDYPAKPGKANFAKITDIHFKNIKGTTTTNTAVAFNCNKASPCDKIEVQDVELKFTGSGPGLSAICTNAKVLFSGKHDGLICK